MDTKITMYDLIRHLV